jgi:hypothetical protein
MASPQRPDPRGTQPHFEPELDTTMPPRSAGRRLAFAWWWIFLLTVLILGLWWAIWGWAGTGGYWWGGRTESKPTVTRQTPLPEIRGMGVEVLTATNRRPFIGRSFQVSTVPVVSKTNSHAVWIGTKTTPPMLLILSNGAVAPNTNIVAGSLLDVTGTVEKAPPAAQAKSEWNLDSNATSQLEKQGVYIQATHAYAIQAPASQ